MTTYNEIQVQSLPTQYAGAITLGTIEDVSTPVTVLVYYENLRTPEQYSATSAVDGTVTITIPTSNRLLDGHYRFCVVLNFSRMIAPITINYAGTDVSVKYLNMKTYPNCVDVDRDWETIMTI